MRKVYIAPEMTSLRYMFGEKIAADENLYDDPLLNASSLLPPTPNP